MPLRHGPAFARLARDLSVDVDLLLARAGQVVSGIGALAAVAMTLGMSNRQTGAALVALCLATGTFYTALFTLLSTRTVRWDAPARPGTWNPPEAVRWLSPCLEMVLPAIVLAILSVTAGPEYALGSWAPPQLFGALVVISVVRADPRFPIVMGAGASAAYALVYALVIAPEIEVRLLLASPQIHLARTLALLAMGGAAGLVAWWLQALVADSAALISGPNVFGSYRLDAELASGGMGRVYDARYCPDPGFVRRVALKLMHPHLANDPAYVARFRNEAEILARLSHPSIVGALDFGTVDDTWFLAMDYVEGRPLSEVLAEHRRVGRPLAPRIVARIGMQIADALEYAHERALDEAGAPLRVVHRDLSPSNILIDPNGRVRLVDFGVARALRGDSEHHTGLLAGKPSYVAPEALREGAIHPSVDLWSLGVILWEALTNQRLFARESEAASMMAVVDANIPAPSMISPTLGPHWDRIVGRLLARDPVERCPSATSLLMDLDHAVVAEGPMTTIDLAEMLAVEHGLEELPIDFTADSQSGPSPRTRAVEEPG